MANIKDIITSKITDKKPKIGIGVLVRWPELENNLKLHSNLVDMVLVSKVEIPGFNTIVSDKPEQTLVDLLINNEVEGIIRGTLDDFTCFSYYCFKTGYDKESSVNPGLMETPDGKMFFLSPASNPEGWLMEEKKKIVIGITAFMKEFGMVPKVAFFTGVRPGSVGKNPKMDQTWYDAEALTKYFNEQGIEAKNYNIELDTAIKEGSNLIVPANGMIGNQIFRAIHACGGRVLICPRVGLPHVYEDDSRTETDYEWHIKYVVAAINNLKK